MLSLTNYLDLAKAISNTRLIAAVLLLCASSGCAYRFSNQNLKTPEGVRTIAIEAIFDTSREVVHHEILWNELQKAFATDGHLRVVSAKNADAIVRAHVKTLQFTPAGETRNNGPEDDPKIKDDAGPELPTQFRVLSQAGKYRDKAVISTVVDVEVWNLWTKTLMLKRSYSVQNELQAIHAAGGITTIGNDFLRLEEASEARYQALAKNIAHQLVRDFLVN